MSSNQQVVSQPQGVLELVVRTLQAPQMQDHIQKALPQGVTLDRFTRATLTAIQQNPTILECDRNSLYNAVVRCAQDGLMPDGRQAAIVAFNTRNKDGTFTKRAQHMPMVEGIIYQMGKAGVPAYAASVYENDDFEQWNDENGQHLKHKPVKLGQERGKRVGCYASGKTKDGAVYVEAMDQNDLDIPRAAAMKKNHGALPKPWEEVPDRMEQKSALHRLAKRIPTLALSLDDENAEIPPAKIDAGPSSPPPSAPAESPSPPENGGKKRGRALQAVIDAGGADPVPAAESSDEQPETKAGKTETKPASAETDTQGKAAAGAGKQQPATGSEVF